MILLQTLFAFLVAIVILVSLHELGHLIVARLCGIKVLRFSVGFGVPFYTKIWRGIEWSIAPIPFGGYVKMLDTREGEVAPEEKHLAFDTQHPLKRIAVVAAGPLTNLALAVVLYALSFSLGGITEIRPLVGMVYPQTLAAQSGFQAGDELLSVNGVAVQDFADAQTRIILNLQENELNIEVKTASGQRVIRQVDTSKKELISEISKQRNSFGLSPFRATREIGVIQAHSAADKAGLKKGDIITAVNNTPTPQWDDWAKIVRENAGAPLMLSVLRSGQTLSIAVLPESRESADKTQLTGYIGVMPANDMQWMNTVRHHFQPTFLQSLSLAWDKTVEYTTLTIQFLGKLLIGQASLDNISGPVTIADIAGQTVRLGWQPYVEFLALISVSLGVMNLLPIPVLDGGHLVFYTIEWIRGKPLSERFQEWGLRFGLTLMLVLMILAFFNDLSRLFG